MITRSSILSSLWVLLLCMAIGAWSARSATAQESKCFSLHVRLNGKAVDGPQVITLKTEQNESTASLEEGCFKVPSALLTAKAVDVSFTVAGNKISLTGV